MVATSFKIIRHLYLLIFWLASYIPWAPPTIHFSNTTDRRRTSSNRALLSKSPPPLRSPIPFVVHLQSFSVRMSSADSCSTTNQIVEHIVLFKVKPSADPSAVAAMLSNLNSLRSIDSVLYISTGPVSRCQSGSSLTFTHVLHSRYLSKSGLAVYAEHPAHVGVVSDFVKPVVDDVMSVDWIGDSFSGSVAVAPGSHLRLSVLKLKSDAGECEKREILGLLREIKDRIPSITQLTAGENFSPGRAKGYSMCSIAVLREPSVLAALNPPLTELSSDARVRYLVEDALLLDFAVGAPARTANL